MTLRTLSDADLDREFRRLSEIRDQAQARISAIGAESSRRLNARLNEICAAKSIADAAMQKGRTA